VFVSFFPRPRLFFLSAIAWSIIAILGWYTFGQRAGIFLGLVPALANAPPPAFVSHFLEPAMCWFYFYFAAATAIFYATWAIFCPHPWQHWSILGSAFLLFTTYLSVEADVVVNGWRGIFFDLLQKALGAHNAVKTSQLYSSIWSFMMIAFLATVVATVIAFFASHYVFRWRTAMNAYYVANWDSLHHIEGAAQRVQEDTMRFSSIVETLGVSFVQSVMSLIVFVPLLAGLSADIKALPLIGVVPYPLIVAAVGWSLFGTALMAVVGIRLPGLNFNNQRVEAAYRKELIYGEDREDRAKPRRLQRLFRNIRANYFRLYFNFAYFNVAKNLYLQMNNIFGWALIIPTLTIGAITLGAVTQIVSALTQVMASFQYLVTSWATIVELLSIHRRLKAFEATLNHPEETRQSPRRQGKHRHGQARGSIQAAP